MNGLMRGNMHVDDKMMFVVTRPFFRHRGFQLPGVSVRPGTGNWLMMPAKVVGIASEAGGIEVSEADTETGCFCCCFCSCCSCRWLPRVDARVLRTGAEDAEVLLLLVTRF